MFTSGGRPKRSKPAQKAEENAQTVILVANGDGEGANESPPNKEVENVSTAMFGSTMNVDTRLEGLEPQQMEEDEYSPSMVVERPDRRRFRRSRPSPSSFTPFLQDEYDDADIEAPGQMIPHDDDDMQAGPLRRGRRLFAGSTDSDMEIVTVQPDSGESGYEEFAELLRSAPNRLPDLLLDICEKCFELSERSSQMAESNPRSTEAYLLHQKSKAFHSEAATWSLLWYLYGREYDDSSLEQLIPPTTQEEACRYVTQNPDAQLCLRIVEWLENLTAREVDRQEQQTGGYLSQLAHLNGIWVLSKQQRRTGLYVQDLDPDAPTREARPLHPEDAKSENMLMRAVWTLLCAGRLQQARQLCRDTGQAWRAASLGGCGDAGPSPAAEALVQAREDQAMELETGKGRQRRLWKFASFMASEKIAQSPDELRMEAAVYAAMCSNIQRMLPVCHNWESACWALCRGWLDFQVDEALRESHQREGIQGRKLTSYDLQGLRGERTVALLSFGASGTESGWPGPVEAQQPKDMADVFQRLYTSELLPSSVRSECRQQHREIQRCLILEDWNALVDFLRQWVTAYAQEDLSARPPGLPSTLRFAAHLILILRQLLGDSVAILNSSACDIVIHMYASQLLAEKREDLVGLYAAQMKPQSGVSFYSTVLLLRQNDSLEVRQRIMQSALAELPFEGAEGSLSDILDSMLAQSRTDAGPPQRWASDSARAASAHRAFEIERKVNAVEWLALDLSDLPQGTKMGFADRALIHSNFLLREIALAALPEKSPILKKALSGAKHLLHWVAKSLPPEETLLSTPHAVAALREHQDWMAYFRCLEYISDWRDAQEKNRSVPSARLSQEEQLAELAAGAEALARAYDLLQDSKGNWLVIEEPESRPAFASADISTGLIFDNHAVPSITPSICEGLADALLTYAGEGGEWAQLKVQAKRSSVDESLLLLSLSCQVASSGGSLLGKVLAGAISGELPEPARGLRLQIARLDIGAEVADVAQAGALARALCRQCCIPALVLKCMQIKVQLSGAEGWHTEEKVRPLLEEVASSPAGLYSLFSQRQLQELLLLEREATIRGMAVDQSKRLESEV